MNPHLTASAVPETAQRVRGTVGPVVGRGLFAVRVTRAGYEVGQYQFHTMAEAEANAEEGRRKFGVLGFNYWLRFLHTNAELLAAFEAAEEAGDDVTCLAIIEERERRGLKITDSAPNSGREGTGNP